MKETKIQHINKHHQDKGVRCNDFDIPELEKVFQKTEQCFGRLLCTSDKETIFRLYSQLHMPLELIEYLIEYCTDKGKRYMHNVEIQAICWLNEGVYELSQAKAKVAKENYYHKVLYHLGKPNKFIAPAERACMDKWMDVYQFNLELIIEACDRSVLQNLTPSFKYVDAILTSWYEKKIRTMEDICCFDNMHKEGQVALREINLYNLQQENAYLMLEIDKLRLALEKSISEKRKLQEKYSIEIKELERKYNQIK